MFFSIQYNLSTYTINIKTWSVTYRSTLESLQKVKFEVINDINSKVSLFQGDIMKINIDAIMNGAIETLISEGGICGSYS